MNVSVQTRAAGILGGIALFEGAWIVYWWLSQPQRFAASLGLAPGRSGGLWSWLLAAAIGAAFVAYSAGLPSVRANLLKLSWLKLLALPMALAAGILEEAVFRGSLMNLLQHQGAAVPAQILLSGLAFGLAHGVWGLFGGSTRAALGATVVTGVLGTALAGVYIVAGRSLLPCIAAHTLIDALIEPGLVLAACRGEMNRLRAVQPA